MAPANCICDRVLSFDRMEVCVRRLALRSPAKAIGPTQQHNLHLEEGLHISDPGSVA